MIVIPFISTIIYKPYFNPLDRLRNRLALSDYEGAGGGVKTVQRSRTVVSGACETGVTHAHLGVMQYTLFGLPHVSCLLGSYTNSRQLRLAPSLQ